MYDLASAMRGSVSYKEFNFKNGKGRSRVEFRPKPELEPWRTHPEHLDIEQNGGERVFERSHITV